MDVVVASQGKRKRLLVRMEALSFAFGPLGFGLGGMYARQLRQVANRMAMAKRMAGKSIANLRIAAILLPRGLGFCFVYSTEESRSEGSGA